MTDLICSYYTTTGVSPAAGGFSLRSFAEHAAACASAGYKGIGLHVRDYRALSDLDPALVFGIQLDDVAPAMQGTMAEDCLNNRLLPGDGIAQVGQLA